MGKSWPKSRKATIDNVVFGAVLPSTTSKSIIEKIAELIEPGSACPHCSNSSPKLTPPPNFDPTKPMFVPGATEVENLPEPGSGLAQMNAPPLNLDLTGNVSYKNLSGRKNAKRSKVNCRKAVSFRRKV